MSDGKTRILVVEDDRLVRSGLAAGLESHGYALSQAESGEEALSIFDASRPDLVVMDICLPGISGIEAGAEIRKRRYLPIVFLTALDDPPTVRDAIVQGGMVYLVKPISVKQLVPVIETALARSDDLHQLRSTGENLATALTQSREISVAIGILMERHGVSAETAFERLRSAARESRRKTIVVANEIISGALASPPPPEPAGKPGSK